MKSCAIIPQVRGKDGDVRDSRLFKDLLSFTNNNRKQTNRIYYTTKNPQFKSDYSDILKYDDAGEVTMKSLLKLDLSSFMEEYSGIQKQMMAMCSLHLRVILHGRSEPAVRSLRALDTMSMVVPS